MVIITPGLHQPQSYHVFIIPIPIRAIPPITAVTVDAISIASESFACDQQAPWRRSWGLSSVFFVFGNAGEIHGNPMFLFFLGMERHPVDSQTSRVPTTFGLIFTQKLREQHSYPIPLPSLKLTVRA